MNNTKINFKEIKVDIKQKDFSLDKAGKKSMKINSNVNYALDKAGRKSMAIKSDVKFTIKEKSMKL